MRSGNEGGIEFKQALVFFRERDSRRSCFYGWCYIVGSTVVAELNHLFGKGRAEWESRWKRKVCYTGKYILLCAPTEPKRVCSQCSLFIVVQTQRTHRGCGMGSVVFGFLLPGTITKHSRSRSEGTIFLNDSCNIFFFCEFSLKDLIHSLFQIFQITSHLLLLCVINQLIMAWEAGRGNGHTLCKRIIGNVKINCIDCNCFPYLSFFRTALVLVVPQGRI